MWPPASPSCRLYEPEAIGAIGPTPRRECGKEGMRGPGVEGGKKEVGKM